MANFFWSSESINISHSLYERPKYSPNSEDDNSPNKINNLHEKSSTAGNASSFVQAHRIL